VPRAPHFTPTGGGSELPAQRAPNGAVHFPGDGGPMAGKKKAAMGPFLRFIFDILYFY
jgi:hypothetical protein